MNNVTWRKKFKRLAQKSLILFILFALALSVVPIQGLQAVGGGTLRQEVNVLDKVKTWTGWDSFSSFSSTDRVYIDPGAYSGNVNFYFEVVASKTAGATGTIGLYGAGGGSSVASINLSAVGTTPARIRVPINFGTISPHEYYLYAQTDTFQTSVTLRSARVIAVQQSANAFDATATQIEIGNNETGKNNTTLAPLTAPKYWKYSAANWDGVKNFSAEVVKSQTGSDFTTTVRLQQDNGSFSGWTDVATIVSDAQTSVRRTRVPFTPVDGRNYRIASFESNSQKQRKYDIYNAKIIVNQTSRNIVAQQPVNGGYFTMQTQTGQSFQSNSNGNLDSIEMALQNTGAPAADMSMNVYACSGSFTGGTNEPTGPVLATSDLVPTSSVTAGGGAVKFPFSGTNQISLTSGGIYCFVAYITNGIKVANFDGVNGNPYQRNSDTDPWQVFGNGTIDLWYKVYTTGSPISKLEPQYLLLNTADSNTTGLQNYRTLWDANEWIGVNNTYKLAIDSNNTSNSAKLQDIDNGNADIAGSNVTGINQPTSAAFTMPASGHQLDVNVTNTSGVISGARIIVVTTIP